MHARTIGYWYFSNIYSLIYSLNWHFVLIFAIGSLSGVNFVSCKAGSRYGKHILYIKRGRDSVHIFSSSLSLYSFHTLKLFSAHTHTYYMYILHVHVHAGIALYTYTQAHRRRGLHCSVYIHTGTQEAWVEPTLLWGYTQAPHKHYGMGGSMKSLCALEPIKSVNPTTKWFLLNSVNTHVMYGQWQCIGQLLTWPCVWHVWRVLCVDCKCIVGNDVQGIMSMHHGQAKYGAALI